MLPEARTTAARATVWVSRTSVPSLHRKPATFTSDIHAQAHLSKRTGPGGYGYSNRPAGCLVKKFLSS
jgi:hypothetical protein